MILVIFESFCFFIRVFFCLDVVFYFFSVRGVFIACLLRLRVLFWLVFSFFMGFIVKASLVCLFYYEVVKVLIGGLISFGLGLFLVLFSGSISFLLGRRIWFRIY